jgi:hypothetical protein
MIRLEDIKEDAILGGVDPAQAVREADERLGCQVIDVSKENCGWDLTSVRLSPEGQNPGEWHIGVKGQSTITVSKNEILYGLNQGDKFLLAIVIVDGDGYEGPYYVRHPFSQEPDWAEVSRNLDMGALIRRAIVREEKV